jgi:hypothetical protein
MSFRYCSSIRHFTRAFHRYGYLAALIASFAQTMAWSQQPQIATIDNNHGQTNTPRQVVAAIAKPIQAYEPTSMLRLAISIKAPKMAAEEKFLKELQDKNSPNFKKYLTPEQWNARFAPSAKDEQSVVDWAASQGLTVTARYPNRLMVNVEGTVDTIQKAFNIKINKYDVGGAIEFSNDHDPVIPGNLVGIIEYVDGLNSIMRMLPANAALKGIRGPDYSPGPVRQNGPSVHGSATAAPPKSGTAKNAAIGGGGQVTNGWYDPSDLYTSNMYDYKALQAQGHCCNPYHTSGYNGGAPLQTSIGLATDGDFANSDIYGFQSQYPYLALFTHRIWVNGTPSCCSDESTLDLEWSLATSNSFGSEFDTAQVFDYEAAQGFGDFGTVFQQMVNDNLVRIVNISYGLNESYLNGFGLVSSWHSIFNQMLGQGMTIMAASGDNGAATGCGAAIATIYPGSDPDVVAVGGTQLALNGDGSFNSEVTWTGDNYTGACTSNHGGTGGGCSSLFAAPGYQTNNGHSPACGSGSRSLPDVALNASSHTAQNYYFNGSLSGVAGTSIASPMMSGFVAQANAYLLAIGLGGAPIGQLNYKLYWLGEHAGNSYEAHYPFYDVTSGCNSNDITNLYGLGSYCAGTGYDLTTGWGSFNALQLSWAINTYDLGDFGAPLIHFTGPTVSPTSDTWFNTDQTVSWTVTDTGGGYPATGVAGFSQAWDNYFSDPTSEATPGSGNSFYSGPQFPNATSGYLQLSWAGQGCHYATVDAWDNSGITSGNQYYYWLCYDTIAPTISIANSPVANSHGWNRQTVTVTLTAKDPGGSTSSGIKKTFFAIDTGACTQGTLGSCNVYTAPFSITAQGWHYIYYFTEDNAGNFSAEPYEWVLIDETAPVTSATLSGTLNGAAYDSAVKITLSAVDSLSGVLATYYQLDGGAVTAYSSPLNITALGAHTVKYYSADYAGNTEVVKSVAFTIRALTTTTLTASPDPSVNGQLVTLKAVVASSPSGTATGTVTFKNGATTLGVGTLSGAVATLSLSTLPVGTDALTASYAGATNFFPSNSATVGQVVHETTSTTITSSLNPSVYGKTVTFTAKVKPSISGIPTGSVKFLNGATLIGTVSLTSGSASFSTAALVAGSHSITAIYSGDSTYTTSTSAVLAETVTLAPTVSTVTSSVNPSEFGESVAFTAKVTSTGGVPTGTVTFLAGGVSIGTATLSGGVATLSTATLAVGTHAITVTYAASADFSASTSPALSEVVHAVTTSTALVSSLNPSKHLQSVTFKATVTPAISGTPTGAVTFKNGSTVLGAVALSGGTASFTTSALPVGTNSITAVYGGSTDDLGSTSAVLSQVVQ